MEVFFVLLLFFGIVVFLYRNNSTRAKILEKVDPQTKHHFVETTSSPSQLYWEYPIVGIKYRKLSHQELESFYCGTLKHDKKNKYDDLAIGVYNENGRCVGYIPVPENEEIHKAMQETGIDEVDVIGSIEKSYDCGYMSWIGRVYIKKEVLNLPEF